jgi:hypothetical protein
MILTLVLASIISVPLGDGDFRNFEYVSHNEFGVEVDFYTDALTGPDPYRSSIPNPPLVLTWPDGWGTQYPYPGYPLPVDPATLPEPSTGSLMLAVALTVALVFYGEKALRQRR